MMETTEYIEGNSKQEPDTPVNELGGFYFSSFLKITDPNTNEVFVQVRGDK